jgi:beta-lactam-binding protein with PASTA domain
MRVLDFFKKHIIIANILLAVAIVCVLVFILLLWLNVYTNHGKEVTVPEVKGLTVEEAAPFFQNIVLKYEVSDSLFVRGSTAGTILETIPPIGTAVKEGRTIYLTVSSYLSKLFTVPDVMDMSQRQAVSLLSSTGFEKVTIKLVPGAYRDLVVGLEAGGRTLTVGDKIQADTRLTLLVSSGTGEEYVDSDSIPEEPGNDESTEEWF